MRDVVEKAIKSSKIYGERERNEVASSQLQSLFEDINDKKGRSMALPSIEFGYLVDPASGHMLVSKIKPCMSKHKLKQSEAANSSLQQPLFT